MTTGPINPLPSGATVFPATAWDGAPFYAGNSPSLTITVLTSPTVAATVQWSPDGVNWYSVTGLDKNFNQITVIGTTFTGPIDYDGNGWLQILNAAGGAYKLTGGL